MSQESVFTRLLSPLFSFFLRFLILDDSQEFRLFNFCLLSKLSLTFLELFGPSLIKVSQESSSLLLLEQFSLSGVSLLFFLCSLGPQSVNFRLSISSFLLEFSHLLQFSLLFFLDSLFLELPFVLSLLLFLVIPINGFIFSDFLLSSLLFKGKRHLIGRFDFKEKLSRLSLLLFDDSFLVILHLLYVC